MKLVYLGAISTSIVLIAGMAMVIPAFIFSTPHESEKIKLLVQIEIKEDKNLPIWCLDFLERLEKNPIKTTVFLTGKVAESHPECIILSDNVDIGSQSFQYENIPKILDYQQQLSQVQKGKRMIESSSGIDSKLFKAPYGATDQNIYSLLSRSGIVADFSSKEQYNLFIDGQFIKFDLQTVENVKELENIDATNLVTFSFSNSDSVDSIFSIIDETQKHNVEFVNPSDLYGEKLTIRV